MSAVSQGIIAIYQDTDLECVFIAAFERTRRCLNGIRIDTYANRTLVISDEQYRVYPRRSSLPHALKPLDDHVIKRIGGGCKSIPLVIDHIRFN